jgi:hypothetical protein
VIDVQTLLQQLPTLIGVLLGAAATYATSSASERLRWRRQQSVRWDTKRLEAYGEYAYALKKVISIAVQMAAQRGLQPDVDWLPAEYGMEALTAAEDERTTKWEKVLLVGSDEAVMAARKWHNSVFWLQRIASGTRTEMTWTEAVSMTSEGRQEFYRVVKRDLGTADNILPDAYEWQLSRLLRSKENHGRDGFASEHH